MKQQIDWSMVYLADGVEYQDCSISSEDGCSGITITVKLGVISAESVEEAVKAAWVKIQAEGGA